MVLGYSTHAVRKNYVVTKGVYPLYQMIRTYKMVRDPNRKVLLRRSTFGLCMD